MFDEQGRAEDAKREGDVMCAGEYEGWAVRLLPRTPPAFSEPWLSSEAVL